MYAARPSPGVQAAGFARRWRGAAEQLLAPAAVLAGAWSAFALPSAWNDGARGHVLVLQAGLVPVVAVLMLIASIALVEAASLRGRLRIVATVAAAVAVAALSSTIAMAIMFATAAWPAPLWSAPVIWWYSFGATAMICVGAVLIDEHRVRGKTRSAALREARLRAANVVRRTAEVRLQAAQARVDPRFLFDTLSAVERVHEADAAAGNRLLDSLVTYLRAVVPDLRDTQSTVGREVDIARLWLDLRRDIVGGIGRHDVDEVAADLRDRRFPRLALTTLTDAVLADAPASAVLAIRAHRDGSRTTVRIACTAPVEGDAAEPASVQALRARLGDSYGEEVRLAFTCDSRGREATVEVDLEESESDRR